MLQAVSIIQEQLMEELTKLRQQLVALEALVKQDSLVADDQNKHSSDSKMEGTPGWFEQTIGAVPESIVVVGEDGRIVHINERAGSLFGYHCDELLGKPIELLLPGRPLATIFGSKTPKAKRHSR